MGDLHQQLLAATDRVWKVGETAPPAAKLNALSSALRAVVDLHAPKDRGAGPTCSGCEITGVGFIWFDRCKTIQAIARELGIEAP